MWRNPPLQSSSIRSSDPRLLSELIKEMRRSMLKLVLVGLVALCIPALSEDKPKLAEVRVVGSDYITVDGFWEPDNPTSKNALVPTSVHIECYRHGGKE